MQRENHSENLPECFTFLREELSKADRATGSRRKLAAALGVSTHTLQRLLTGTDLPDLARERSSYVRSSWTRTLTRMALGLGIDPERLLRSACIEPDAHSLSLVNSEKAKFGMRSRKQSEAGSMPDLAGFIMALAGSWPGAGSAPGSEALQRLQEAIAQFLVATGSTPPGLADGSDLSGGSFCRSCMASLTDTENRGASDHFCRWCSDDDGNLRSAEEVHGILTKWFMQWQKGITGSQAAERARHYMLAMPAWTLNSGL